MMDLIRDLVEHLRQALQWPQALYSIVALFLAVVLLGLEYYVFRTARRTHGLASRIEAEVGPWLAKIGEKHFGEGSNVDRDRTSQ